jgi:hypothetical protein
MTKAELDALEAILSTPICSLHALPPAAAVRLAMQTRGYSLTAAQNVATLYGAAPALVAEVRRLREALKEITRLGTGHSLDSALVVARAALAPPAPEEEPRT